MSGGRLRYARSGAAHIAFRTWGDADTTVVFVLGWTIGSCDAIDDPSSPYAAGLELLLPNSRVIAWDRRGTGLSDPLMHLPTIDDRVDDLCAVLDAAGAESVVLWATSEGGPVAISFAATRPERVRALVLLGTAARFSRQLPEHPWGFSRTEIEQQLDSIDDLWGQGALAELFMGTTADMPGVRDELGRLQRGVSSPMMAKMLWQETMCIDVRTVLCDVVAPTLVMARPGDRFVSFDAAVALAEAMPNARFHALPPGDHHGFDIIDGVIAELFHFVGKPKMAASERVLSTVLFTDIVCSTETLSAHGDAHWRHQLDVHDRVVDTLLAKYGGRRVKHTGDGVLAMVDGPTKAAQCGMDLVTALATRGIRIRVGVHVGECERRGDEWSGVAVHVGARIVAIAGTGEVLASRTVRDLCAGSELVFADIGAYQLKGLPDAMPMYRVSFNGNRR